MRTYLNLFHFSFLTILAYPYELLITVIEPVIEIGFLALFWNMIATHADKPVDLVNLITYFIMVQFVSIWSLTPGGLGFVNFIGYRIKTGELSRVLIRPLKVLPSLLAEHRGYYAVDMIFSVTMLAAVFFLMGNIAISQIVWFLIFLFFSFVITFSICILIGSIAFITKEINSIRHSISHLIRILSGSMVPLTFFPEQTRDLLYLTPFPSMMFMPINVLQNKLPPYEILTFLTISVFWSIILMSFALLVWKINLKKYEAVGI